MKPQLLASLKEYKISFLFSDLISGLLVAVIALSMSIALGIQSVPQAVSSRGIQMGIITAIVAGFIISALGGTRFQIGGPTPTFVVIIYNFLANPQIGLLGLQFATILAGIWLILLALVKAGKIMKYIPYPIVVGFTTSIGITLLVGQIKDFLGLNAAGTDVIGKLISCARNISTFNLATFLLGAAGLVVIFAVQKVNKKIPAAFITLLLCTLGNIILEKAFGGFGVQTIGTRYGDVKAEFYPLSFEAISQVNFAKLIVPSFVIAFLGGIESLLSAKVADGITKTKHDSNTELMAQGVANIFSSLLGGLPATGAIARTSANIRGGAKSPLSGIFHSLFVFLMYFALMGVIKHVPMVAFATILISVAINMANLPLFFKSLKFGVRDGVVLVTTCVLTLIFDLTYGVIGGLVLTFALNAVNFPAKLVFGRVKENGREIHRVSGALHFLNAHTLTQYLNCEFEKEEEIFLDFSQLKSVDHTGLQKLAEYNKGLFLHGKTLNITGGSGKVKYRLEKYFDAA